MKQQYDLMVVIPIGPNCKLPFIEDTLNSIIHYCLCTYKIILIDDSKKDYGTNLKNKYTNVDVIINKQQYGLLGGLYVTLSHAFIYALDNYQFKALLRMDTDALITGYNPQAEAIAMFEKNPKIGIAGFIKRGKEPRDFAGNPVENYWPMHQITTYALTWRFLSKPKANYALRKLLIKALLNGYAMGENVFGGAYIVSQLYLQKLREAKMLPDYGIQKIYLEEDHIFGLLTKAIDFDFGDLETGNLPFGVSWRGLPTSPEELYNKHKKIIHSTKKYKDMTEASIRQFFSDKRSMDKMPD
ncbi:MAG: glycosyltransferase family 2 protein [Sphingobacteriaceae bacterium]|nr:MAG: glycosyltransferase family 2 protein [Sphingobacteriaceae bacterium]